MMNDNNMIPKIEISADLSNTVNEAYKDTAQKPLQSGSKAVTTLLDFFNNTILYPMQKYNLYAENKLNNFAKELQERASKIPNENLVEPKVNILGPAIEGLKYNLDEEHIKEMFTNILLSNMNNKKQCRIHPSFIDIVKQLSTHDAITLKLFKDLQITEEAIIKLKYISKNRGFILVNNDIFLIHSSNINTLSNIVIDNLLRLKLIETDFLTHRNDEKIYENAFNILKPLIPPSNDPRLIDTTYDMGILKVTKLGQDFIDICLS